MNCRARVRAALFIYAIALTLVSTGSQAQSIVSTFLPSPDTIENAASSVLKLEVYEGALPRGNASGFVVFDGKTLVTNHHVIRRGDWVIAESDKGNLYIADIVIAADEQKDIAILEFHSGTDLDPLPIKKQELWRGGPVMAISSPHGIKNTVSFGNISALYEKKGIPIIQFTAPVSPGSSGGALFDPDGSVIGLIFSIVEGTQNMNLAVRIEDVQELYLKHYNDPRIDMKDFYAEVKAPRALPLEPYTPGNLRAYDLGRAVRLTWDEGPGSMAYYIISRSKDRDGFFFNIGYATENRFIDMDPQKDCWYRVQSTDGDSISTPSSPVQASLIQ